MALKTFNVDAEIYRAFSDHCKREGISMSKKVEKFLKAELERLELNSKREKISASGEKEPSPSHVQESEEHIMGKYC